MDFPRLPSTVSTTLLLTCLLSPMSLLLTSCLRNQESSTSHQVIDSIVHQFPSMILQINSTAIKRQGQGHHHHVMQGKKLNLLRQRSEREKNESIPMRRETFNSNNSILKTLKGNQPITSLEKINKKQRREITQSEESQKNSQLLPHHLTHHEHLLNFTKGTLALLNHVTHHEYSTHGVRRVRSERPTRHAHSEHLTYLTLSKSQRKSEQLQQPINEKLFTHSEEATTRFTQNEPFARLIEHSFYTSQSKLITQPIEHRPHLTQSKPYTQLIEHPSHPTQSKPSTQLIEHPSHLTQSQLFTQPIEHRPHLTQSKPSTQFIEYPSHLTQSKPSTQLIEHPSHLTQSQLFTQPIEHRPHLTQSKPYTQFIEYPSHLTQSQLFTQPIEHTAHLTQTQLPMQSVLFTQRLHADGVTRTEHESSALNTHLGLPLSQGDSNSSHAEHSFGFNSSSLSALSGDESSGKQERDIQLTKSESPGVRKDELLNDISEVFNYNELMLSNGGDVRRMKVCRQKTYLPQFLFHVHSCAACYYYMRNVSAMFGSPSRKWETPRKLWRSPDGLIHEVMVLASPNNVTYFANSSDSSSPHLSSFVNEHARRNWMDCCEAADKCCEKMQMKSFTHVNSTTDSESPTCPATWDSWQCWNETEAGKTAYAPCPHYIYSVLSETSSCSSTAEKTCQPDGHWYSRSRPGHPEWTNYSNCAASVIEVQKRRTYVHVTAYGVSIIAIIPALFVFFAYKQLRVDRIILHQNLFSSMLANGIFVIAFKTIIILNELSSDSSSSSTIINENGIGCRLLFILTKYSRMTNYMWMFCEGYYLHKLIASAFAEQKSLIIFYLIGWIFPIIPTVIYGCLRLVYSNERCWVVPEESFEWILNGPSLMSLLINFLFLINIIRVLVTKLRAAHANEPSQYRKAVRATLVLLPLFGLHFVVTIYRPPASGSSGTCEWLEIYFYTNDILDGVQGFLVALIFCYLNGEVVFLLRRSYARWTEQRLQGCSGRHSSTRLQSRSSRGGSIMLGRSVVSTQCYSSVPASPEVCCNINRLSFSSTNQTTQIDKDKRQSPSEKPLNTSTLNVNGSAKLSPTSKNIQNHTNSSSSPHSESVVKIRSNNDSPSTPWTEIRLNCDANTPTSSLESKQGLFEMKPQRVVRISPTSIKNGIKNEHQL